MPLVIRSKALFRANSSGFPRRGQDYVGFFPKRPNFAEGAKVFGGSTEAAERSEETRPRAIVFALGEGGSLLERAAVVPGPPTRQFANLPTRQAVFVSDDFFMSGWE